MKTVKLALALFLLLTLSHCTIRKQVAVVEVVSEEVSYKTSCTWLYYSSFPETLCFPGLEEIDTSFDSIDVQVYNRWGELQFETQNKLDNWVCNDSSTCDIKQGTYFSVFLLYNQDSTQNDTISVTITIIHNRL